MNLSTDAIPKHAIVINLNEIYIEKISIINANITVRPFSMEL